MTNLRGIGTLVFEVSDEEGPNRKKHYVQLVPGQVKNRIRCVTNEHKHGCNARRPNVKPPNYMRNLEYQALHDLEIDARVQINIL